METERKILRLSCSETVASVVIDYVNSSVSTWVLQETQLVCKPEQNPFVRIVLSKRNLATISDADVFSLGFYAARSI
ncbi:MAG: hypothetical protein EAZ63_03580 [Runella slithyformis]|nr:MAG: hypothetical protein EAZ63_03580 [Runella slithyformis]